MAKRKQREQNPQRGLFDQSPPPRPEVAEDLQEAEEAAERERAGRKRLFVVDVSGYIFRAYFALPPLATSAGVPTGATYGFTSMLLKILREESPQHLVIVWDAPGESFRHEIYDEYKANRSQTPDDLIDQFGNIRRIVDAWNLPQLEVSGYEADDTIAGVARQLGSEGVDVVIVSSDKDLMQLVGGSVSMLDTMKNKLYGPEEVEAKLGVPPGQVADYLALIGDTSDNIPGIRGVGPKTATKLLEQFGSLEAILEHSDQIEKTRWRNLVQDHVDEVKLSRELVELKPPDIEVELDEFHLREPDYDELRDIFEELEFGRLLKEIGGRKISRAGYRAAQTLKQLKEIASELRSAERFAFDTETTSLDPTVADLVGMSVCADNQRAWYVPLGHSGPDNPEQVSLDDLVQVLGPIFEDASVTKIAQNAKYDVLVLERHGLRVEGRVDEPMLAAYVLNPSKQNFGLSSLSQDILGHTMIAYEEVAGKGRKEIPFDEVSVARATQYAAEDAHITWLLWEKLGKQLADEPELVRVYEDIELPLVPILMDMERLGIALDVAALKKASREYEKTLMSLEKKIHEAAGSKFNVNSPQQLREILFKQLELPVIRRTKSGPSTDKSVLEELSAQHEVPRLILEFRELAKLKSTYIDALPAMVNPATGRIHSSWNQTVAATGRLSSSDPNLQNIPIRSEEGRKIREAFVAEKGYQFVAADYSQMELRVMAHVTGDPILVETFLEGEDVHARTAREVFGEYNDDLRRRAKAINFGIIYGLTQYGLARQLGIERKDAADFIERYLDRYSGVRDYMQETIEFARERGYVQTLYGRRRHMPQINHRNKMQREAAERAAINAPIQGTAADVMKIAMIEVFRRLHDAGQGARLLAQIHDELLLEVPDAAVEETRALLVDAMEGAADFRVPLVVDVAVGHNWAEV